MKTIAFLLHNNFEQAEYEEVNNQLKDKGYKTVLITTNKDKEVQGMQQDVNKGDTFTADIFAKDANVADYEALVLPGGTVNADTMRGNEEAHSIISSINNAGKPLAVICHAPWVLINTGIAKGKTLTAYHSLQTDLENAGANFVDKSVQVDGNLITSRNPDDINDLFILILRNYHNFKIITTKKEIIMSNPNPNDTKLEQQRSESATAALKGQTEDNHTEDTEAAADRIADNLKNAKEEK